MGRSSWFDARKEGSVKEEVTYLERIIFHYSRVQIRCFHDLPREEIILSVDVFKME
jgi:hypothetical protein